MSKAKCQICGGEFDFINNTHLKKHGISPKEYSQKFPNVPSISDEYRKRRSEISIKMYQEHPGMNDQISESNKKNWEDKDFREFHSGKNCHMFGKTKENSISCKKISETLIKLYKEHPELKDQISKAQTGREPTPTMIVGYKKGAETLKANWQDPEFREAHSGENGANWQGGISNLPYCYLFNNEFKERNREFFNRTCMLCDKTEAEIIEDMIVRGKRPCKLHIHHITYNKNTCCDNTAPLFVSLCISCNNKVNANREYWEQYFTNLIMTNYNGKCFYTKEEMEIIKNKHLKLEK